MKEQFKHINDNGIRNNSFLCEVNLNGIRISPLFTRTFYDNIEAQTLVISFSIDTEFDFPIEKLENLFLSDQTNIKGIVSFSNYNRIGKLYNEIEYIIDRIFNLQEPIYDTNDTNLSMFYLTLHYNKKEYQGKKNEKKYKEEDDSKNFKNSLDFFKKQLLRNKEPWAVKTYDKVTEDLNNNTRHSLVVCSRSCGMTTHLLAYYLAKIDTEHSYNVWFLTPYNNSIRNIFDVINVNKLRRLNNFDVNIENKTITNPETGSKITFIAVSSQNLENKFVGKELPDTVVYDDMAFMNNTNLQKFMEMLNDREKAKHKFVKEVCVSTPSKDGSVFNFLGIISDNKIQIPWYLVHNEGLFIKNNKLNGHITGNPEVLIKLFEEHNENNNMCLTSPWFEQMKDIMTREQIETELCCCLDVEENNEIII